MAELFKYKTVNKYLFDSLKNKYLYFSKPKELDDIFECKIVPDFSLTTDDEIQKWIDLHKGKGSFPYSTIADVRSDMLNGSLFKHYINNPEIIEKYHILSLCEERDNQKLWSLYANTYKGICIGYHVERMQNMNGLELPDIYGLEITHPQKSYPRSHIIGKIESRYPLGIFELNKTQYINEGQFSYDWISEKLYDNSTNKSIKFDGKTNPLTDRSKINQLIINSKSSYWKEQNEYRAFYHENDTKESKIYYPDETLSSITFGFNLSEKDRKKIYKLVTKKYSNSVRFEIAEPDYTTRKIKFTPYRP